MAAWGAGALVWAVGALGVRVGARVPPLGALLPAGGRGLRRLARALSRHLYLLCVVLVEGTLPAVTSVVKGWPPDTRPQGVWPWCPSPPGQVKVDTSRHAWSRGRSGGPWEPKTGAVSSSQGLTSAETQGSVAEKGRKWGCALDGEQALAGLGRGLPAHPGDYAVPNALLTGPFESPSAARLALLGGWEVMSCFHPGAFPTFVLSPGEVVSAQSTGGGSEFTSSTSDRAQRHSSATEGDAPPAPPAPGSFWPLALGLPPSAPAPAPRPQTQLSNRKKCPAGTPASSFWPLALGLPLSAPAPASGAGRWPRPLLPCRGDTWDTHTYPTSPGNACLRHPPLKIGNPVFCHNVDRLGGC